MERSSDCHENEATELDRNASTSNEAISETEVDTHFSQEHTEKDNPAALFNYNYVEGLLEHLPYYDLFGEIQRQKMLAYLVNKQKIESTLGGDDVHPKKELTEEEVEALHEHIFSNRFKEPTKEEVDAILGGYVHLCQDPPKKDIEEAEPRKGIEGRISEMMAVIQCYQELIAKLDEEYEIEKSNLEILYKSSSEILDEQRHGSIKVFSNFWAQAFMSSDVLFDYCCSPDHKILKHLLNIVIEEDDIDCSIILTFEDNEYFENVVLKKSFLRQGLSLEVNASKILWKCEFVDSWVRRSFFSWFEKCASDPEDDEIISAIRGFLKDPFKDLDDEYEREDGCSFAAKAGDVDTTAGGTRLWPGFG